MKKLFVLSIALFFSASAMCAEESIRLTHMPYLQNLGDDCVTIVWVASHNSVGWVEIAPDDSSHFYQKERERHYDCRNGIKQESKVHSVKITGLKPGTKYRYRVFAQEVTSHVKNRVMYGRVASTKVYRKEPLCFTTSSPDSKSFEFIMLNDIHGQSDRMKALLKASSVSDADMVIFNGDMVSVFGSEDTVFSGFMDGATSVFASEIPMYYTRGNHETRGEMAYYFQRYFSPFEQHIYYAFRRGDTCFVIMDTGEDKPDSDIEYAGIVAYDQYRSEEALWLKNVLQSDMYRTAAHRIVVQHMPPQGDWHGNYEICTKFLPLLRDAKPDVMLCGHVHKYLYYEPSQNIPFPVVINSNKTALRVSVSEKGTEIKVIDETGKVTDTVQTR